MDSPKLNEKVHRMCPSVGGGATKRHGHSEHGDDDLEASSSQILERVKSDRIAVTKPEEDWRRRTIIVEKKNGTFGFTLQSYGIHYKKEQEIEMITYVDYVEFDGPAYRAGMREGDVILSINGTDMEKSDHKTLVNFIKQCDTRMRMVVLFEDCVRKVELHIRYIELQRIIQDKMTELERLCLREREMLDGKWKTHSLPSQRKKANGTEPCETTPSEEDIVTYSYCRPTVSTEDVATKHKQSQILLTYQYLDPNYRTYILQPTTSRSGDYVVSLGPPRSKSDHHHFIVKTPCTGQSINITSRHIPSGKVVHQTNGMQTSTSNKPNKKGSHHHSHRCNPCYPPQNNQDSASLEAYDLASPCCDPHCVPSAKRRSRHHKHHDKEHSHRKKEKPRLPERESNKRESSSQTRSKSQCQPSIQHSTGKYRYLNFGAGLVSQCSLQSCTSSEMSVTVPTCESSVTSYTTSLSSDTLYWDNPNDTRHSRTPPKVQNLNNHHHQAYPPQCKPKSWDNLTTKAFGGYGFGYGYSDASNKQSGNPKGHSRAHSTKSAQEHRAYRHSANEKQIQHGMYLQHHGHHRYTPPTKSTESLLVVSKYHDPTMSDSSISCECLDVVSPDGTLKATARFFQQNQGGVIISPTDQRNTGYYSQHIPRPQLQNLRNHTLPSTTSEITRL